MAHRFRRYLPVIAALLIALVAQACRVNPATGRQTLDLLPESQEIALGAQAQPEFLAEYGGEIPDEHISQYVRNIGLQLAAVSERPELPWEFHVLDSAVINAFALPGGKVFISRALLERMTNEAQLAGVLGHEVGHVTALHINERMNQTLIAQGVLLGIGAATEGQLGQILGIGAEAGATVYLLSFNRDQEREADDLGLRYMTRIGYNPMGQAQVMRILAEAGRGQQRPPEWLSTHPEPDGRAQRLENLIPEQYPNWDTPGSYAYREAEYRANILDRLQQLPPPRHRPQ